MDTITGCWEGALLAEDGSRTANFAFRQPEELRADSAPTLWFDGARLRARLLEGAARSFVALIDTPADRTTGRIAQLLLDVRVRGDRLVGEWLRRDDEGRVVAHGQLRGARS